MATDELNELLYGEGGGFLYQLSPGKYWLSVPHGLYAGDDGLKVLLRRQFGRDAFRTVETRQGERNDWFVLDVRKPIELDPDMITDYGPWKPGDSSQSTGVHEIPDPSWIHEASELVDDAKKAGSISLFSGAAVLGVGAGLFLLFKAMK